MGLLSVAVPRARKRIELVVGDDGLEVAVGLDRGERLARGGDAAEDDAERIVERARGGVQAAHQIAQHERVVFDDEDAADGLGHRAASV